MSCLAPVWEEQIHTVLHHLSCHCWIYSKQDVMQQMKAAAANFHCDKLTNFPQIFFAVNRWSYHYILMRKHGSIWREYCATVTQALKQQPVNIFTISYIDRMCIFTLSLTHRVLSMRSPDTAQLQQCETEKSNSWESFQKCQHWKSVNVFSLCYNHKKDNIPGKDTAGILYLK